MGIAHAVFRHRDGFVVGRALNASGYVFCCAGPARSFYFWNVAVSDGVHRPAIAESKFGLWTGIILSLGNAGMMLSASPYWGWRIGFLAFTTAATLQAIAEFCLVNSPNKEIDRSAEHFFQKSQVF